ncbi:MAG: hypothetical protein KDK12_19785 [Rhodobacteraceae bacterium]|nr:hypothetical protein [Paracoccaceae bacterium]
MTPPLPVPPRRPGRGLRLALVLSLMVNVLVLGILAGGAMRASRFDGPLPGQADVRALWQALPGEARSTLRAMGRERGFPGEHGPRPSREERRERAAALNARLLEALRGDPFDAEAFARLMQGDREALERRLDAAHAAFAEQVAALSPAERQDMAARLAAIWTSGDRR